MTLPEPIRLEELDGVLSDAQRNELLAYRQTGPDADLKLEMWENLARTRAAGMASRAPRAPRGSAGALRWWSAGLCAALIAGILLLRPKNAPEPRVPPPGPVAPAATELAPAPPAVRDSPPSTAAPASRPASKPTRPHGDASAARVDALAELALLTRARRLLPSRPETSLALSREHAQLYPRGALAEEREVLAIEALLKLGRASQARERARAFVRHFPGSSQRGRLDALLVGKL